MLESVAELSALLSALLKDLYFDPTIHELTQQITY